MLPPNLVLTYSNAVAVHGVDSTQVQELRELHKDNPDFMDFAEGRDIMQRRINARKRGEVEVFLSADEATEILSWASVADHESQANESLMKSIEAKFKKAFVG